MSFRLFTDLVLRSSAAISSTAYARQPGGADTTSQNEEIYEQLRDGVLRPCIRIVGDGITKQLVPTLLPQRCQIDDRIYNVGVINTFDIMPYYAEHKIISKQFLMTDTKKCRGGKRITKHDINTFAAVGNAINISVAKQADCKKMKKNNANGNDSDDDDYDDDNDNDYDVLMKQKTKKMAMKIFLGNQ